MIEFIALNLAPIIFVSLVVFLLLGYPVLVRPKSKLLNAWIVPPLARGDITIPLSNALTPSRNPRVKRTASGAIGHLFASNNDMQNAG